jgi:hypothetical protein
VPLTVQVLAEATLGEINLVTANDSARASFTVLSGDRLLALDAGLNVLAEWPAGSRHRAYHATAPDRGLALISAPDEVRLLDRAGRVLWRHAHEPWSGDCESGCAWFDHAGDPYAVVLPLLDYYDGCRVRRFDLASGQVLAEARIEAAPAGIHPVHQPDGWVGLSEGEGQDAVQAWWVRSRPGTPEFDLLDAGWDDWVFADADPAGTRILTLPRYTSPLLVRSFPALDIIQSFDPPEDYSWDHTAYFTGDSACFAGDLIIATMMGDNAADHLIAIDGSGTRHDLGESDDDGQLVPAAGGTWLSVTETTIRRCRAVRA